MGADLFAPSDVPKMVPVGDFRGLDLTPEEGFLLSRIDGRVNVGAILSMVAWDREKTMQLLESLLRKHLLNFERAEIADRVFGTGNIDAPPLGGREASATPGLSITLTPVNEQAPSDAFTIDPATVERVPDLDPARCVEVLTWARRVESAENLYQMFEIPLGADAKSVKRQYRQMAMLFHPDKFFRKDIGGYRFLIELNWKKIQEGYELLSEPDKKAAYDEDVLAKARSKPRAMPVAAPAPVVARPAFTPGPPPPSKAPAGQQTATPEIPPWDAKGSPATPPRPRVETAFERKLKADVIERLGKARRQFEQAQKDYADGKFSGADSNAKLAMQFDPRNEDYKRWYDSIRPKLEEGMMSAMLRKAELSEASGDMKAAADEYEKALQVFPDNLQANLGLGKVLAFRGDNPRRARECLQKGLAAKPNDLVAILAMCRVLRDTGMVKNALRFIEKAKEIAPKDARVLEEAKEIKKANK